MQLSRRLRSHLGLPAARAVAFGLSALTSAGLARLLGPDRFGEYAAGSAIASLLLVLGAFGLDQLFLRGVLSETTTVTHLRRIGVLAMGICVAGALMWPSISSTTRVCVVLLGWAIALERVRQVWLLAPQRAEQFEVRARREVETALVLAAAALLTATVSPRATPVSLATATGSLVLTVSVWPRRGLPKLRLRETATALRRGLPYAVSSALFTVYFVADVALLASISGETEAGMYRIAYTVLSVALVLSAVLNNDMLRPKLYNRGVEASRDTSRRFLAANLAAGAGLALLTLVAGSAAVRIAFGSDYRAASKLLPILACAVVPNFFNSWAGNSLIAYNRIRAVLWLQGGLAAGNIIANLIVLPSHGARGAAYTTVGTELTGVVAYLVLLRRRTRNDAKPLS